MYKVAVITGASRGIGYEIALELSEDYNLILCASRKENLDNISTAIKDKNPDCKITLLAFDVSNEDDINTSLVSAIEQHGQVDVLVNNAGVLIHGGIDAPSEDYRRTVEVNQFGLFYITKVVLPYMRKQQSGYIFNISSMAGIRPVLGSIVYSSSKYAVTGFSANLGLELLEDNIKVTAICPSVIDTDMTADFNMPKDKKIRTSDISKTVRYCLSLSPNAVIDTVNIQCPAVINPLVVK